VSPFSDLILQRSNQGAQGEKMAKIDKLFQVLKQAGGTDLHMSSLVRVSGQHLRGHQSLTNQREVGIHTHRFPSALKAALREDPDMILDGGSQSAVGGAKGPLA
jgi:hypothetical protein